MAVALLALVPAMAGSAYAAVTITGADVKDGSLTGRDIKDGSIHGRDVSGLTGADFKAGALPAGPEGPRGPAGDPGPTGTAGAPGGLLEALPSGATLRGIYDAESMNHSSLAITFQPPLAAVPAHVAFLAPADPRPEGCPSSNAVEVVQAAPGWVCIYQTNSDVNDNIQTKAASWSRFGFQIGANGTTSGVVVLEGRWAVTAP